jgi:hypothetical protein
MSRLALSRSSKTLRCLRLNALVAFKTDRSSPADVEVDLVQQKDSSCLDINTLGVSFGIYGYYTSETLPAATAPNPPSGAACSHHARTAPGVATCCCTRYNFR